MEDTTNIETAPEDLVDPPLVAETCMRELVGRASFGHIRTVLRPVLRYTRRIFFVHKNDNVQYFQAFGLA